jgi:hypothetical protein
LSTIKEETARMISIILVAGGANPSTTYMINLKESVIPPVSALIRNEITNHRTNPAFD